MDRVSINEASKLLGMSALKIRVLMQRGLLDIGQAFPPEKEGGNWEYIIVKAKLEQFLGREI